MQINKQSLKWTNFRLLFFIPLLSLFILTSCEVEDEALLSSTVASNVKKNESSKMILGKKLENPFSLRNMIKAQKMALGFKEKVKNGKYSRAFNSLKAPLSTTHRYIKFKPRNKTHMSLAEELFKNRSIVTKHHPMDQEIVQYGEDYVDPETIDERYPVFYASVPVGFAIPNIPYTVMEDLYLPKKDLKGDLLPNGLLLEGFSRFLTGNIKEKQIKEIKEKSLQFKSSAIEDMISNGKETIQAKALWDWLLGSKYIPQGVIKVYDTNTNTYVPYKYASIEIYTWFDNAYAWADATGFYRSPETFRFGVGVYATWRNPSATIRSSWNELLGLWVTDKLTNLSKSSNNRTTYIEHSDKHKWLKATTHLAFEKFNLFLSEKEVETKVQDANVWISSDNNNHRGSTPMLNKYRWSVSNSIYFTSWLSWFSPITLSFGNVATAIFGHLYPDMTFTYKKHNTRDIDALVFHESAHYIHARKSGNSLWSTLASKEVDNIINYGGAPYNDGTTPSLHSGQLIALAEGWAEFIEHRVMIDAYNLEHGYSSESLTNFIKSHYGRLENFDMRAVPFSEGMELYADGRAGGWFLSGLFWDLYDTNDDSVGRFNNVSDIDLNIGKSVEDVEGDIKPIFDLLTGDVYGAVDLKNVIKQNYPQISKRVDHLFNLYGY
ncbi:hypothetical protein [Tenacibaculum maritimum]|uniref:hypothetical protein n=1 Tax=Tenacibaculum maritimum TaxID=107401 RepID=UPI0012E5D75A|nr:hypothetical protein [Tenacibaculum maritimum]CAA0253866.1 hypothetical protein JIP4600_90097 [Tenacibaculum maritimum]